MSDPKLLIVQIERAKRFAAAMTNNLERLRFEAMADEYLRELETSSAARQISEKVSSKN